jgi:hypothetical protein
VVNGSGEPVAWSVVVEDLVTVDAAWHAHQPSKSSSDNADRFRIFNFGMYQILVFSV